MLKHVGFSIGGISVNTDLYIGIGTIVTTLIGFIVTYLLTKRNLKGEISKAKTTIGLEKMEDIPFLLLNMLDQMKDGTMKTQDYTALLHKIYAYGTADAIKIAVTMQHMNYELDDTSIDKFRLLTLLSLLISQIKFDLTGEIINPENWFVMKIKDYTNSELEKKVPSLINEDISRLKLNSHFLIKRSI